LDADLKDNRQLSKLFEIARGQDLPVRAEGGATTRLVCAPAGAPVAERR
jgi:hypothetical protein